MSKYSYDVLKQGVGCITHHGWIYDLIYGPIRKSCQKFVDCFMNNECHEKDDTIDNCENDGGCKSRLVIIQL